MKIKDLFLEENFNYFLKFMEKENRKAIIDDQILVRIAIILNGTKCLHYMLYDYSVNASGTEKEILTYAIEHDDVALAKYAVKNGVDIDFLHHNQICAAIAREKHNIIKYLLEIYEKENFDLIGDMARKSEASPMDPYYREMLKRLIENY